MKNSKNIVRIIAIALPLIIICCVIILVCVNLAKSRTSITSDNGITPESVAGENVNTNIKPDTNQSTTSADTNDILNEIVTRDPDAVVSVGIWENGSINKYLYTTKGKEDFVYHRYQIGSITKTFTASLLAYEVNKNYISMDEGNPSLNALVTHRSGLGDIWEQELQKNPDATFTRDDLLQEAATIMPDNYSFEYSNFGSAVAGTRAAMAYATMKELTDSSYQNVMDTFITDVLGLSETKVGGKGEFKNNWNWHDKDEMLADGSITSTVDDLLKYGSYYLSNENDYAFLKEAIKPINTVDETYDIGMFWLIDKETGMFWHNGELNMDDELGKEVGYQSFIGINPEKNRVVVILSNSICYTEDETAYTDILGYLLCTEENADSADTTDSGDNTDTDDNTNNTADSSIDNFLNGAIGAKPLSETDNTLLWVSDLGLDTDEWDSYYLGDRKDLDNDGENEQIFIGPYGGMYLDARDGKLYVMAQGEGTAVELSYTTYDNAVWIVYSDITHAGRENYQLTKYQGGDKIVDSFELKAEYYENNIDEYTENSDFTYRDKKITMDEFEKLKKEIFPD